MKILKKLSILILCGLYCSGCSTINFSANYYNLPDTYQTEISFIWQKLKSQLKLKNEYSLQMIDGADSKKANGVPFISNTIVYVPKDFIKYVYQEYYDDRFKILINVITHEICHTEYHLPGAPVSEHFKVDVYAISLLGGDTQTADYFYKSLFVVKNYWFARKGMAGHALNFGWNALSGASLAFGGPSFFMDLYATDLNQRMEMIKHQYKLESRQCFKQTHQVTI